MDTQTPVDNDGVDEGMNAMRLTQALQDLTDFIACQNDQVRSHLRPLSREEHWCKGVFLRIDKNTPDVFVPNLPKTSMKGENNTVPRVSVAPTMLGCLVGYFRAEYDVVYSGGKTIDGEKATGGYIISEFSTDVFIRPDNSLVPQEVERSDEHWLVAYDPEHAQYTAKAAGKCFISEVTYANVGGDQRPMIYLTLWIEVISDSLWFAPGKALSKGFYKVKLHWHSLLTRSVTRADEELMSLNAVDEQEYLEHKKISADLLSYQEPRYLKW